MVATIAFPLFMVWGGWMSKKFLSCCENVEDLYNMHDVKDPTRPGAYAWYDRSIEVREELKDVIAMLAEERKVTNKVLANQTEILKEILRITTAASAH